MLAAPVFVTLKKGEGVAYIVPLATLLMDVDSKRENL